MDDRIILMSYSRRWRYQSSLLMILFLQFQDRVVVPTSAFGIITSSRTNSKSLLKLHVVSDPQRQKVQNRLFDDDDDDDDDDLVSKSQMNNKNRQRNGNNPFIDLDDEIDSDNDYVYPDYLDESVSMLDYVSDENDNTVTVPSTYEAMERDEADILEEREDRLYLLEHQKKLERCILVGVEDLSAKRRAASNINNVNDPTNTYFTLEESMIEMRELIKTAGLELVGEITQNLNQINPKTYIGTGKVQEAKELIEQLDSCSTIVFDAELTPGQQKALENSFNKNLLQNDFLVQDREIKVIDRTALILDIFAQHAKTREGKLQVDLAIHEYRKPRLTRMWTHLERQSGAGGVGLRGPGETQLEMDKRILRDRIIVLKQKIDDIHKQRTMHRRGRERMGLPILSLVGYTNAGKSSLLNYLTRSGVLAESMLFATLDPTTRKVKLPGLKTHPEVLLTDTVGFIQKLPTHLVAAFRATLEEVKQSDVLVHVIDVSNPSWQKQERAVNTVLNELGVTDKPIVRVLNKIDLLDPEDAEYLQYDVAVNNKLTVAVSALHGHGMEDFVAVVEEAMISLLESIEVIIPYAKGDEINAVHEQGNVEYVDYREDGTYIKALVPEAIANRLAQYSVNQQQQNERVSIPEQNNDDDDDEIDWVALGRGRHDTTKKDDTDEEL